MAPLGLVMEQLATRENFDERADLAANPDVAAAVQRGDLASGRRHFQVYSYKEGRRLRMSAGGSFAAAKKNKLARVRPLLRSDMPYADGHGCLDFLTPELRERFAIIDSDAVSVNEYDGYAMGLIDKHRRWIGPRLRRRAGRRSFYVVCQRSPKAADHELRWSAPPK